MTMSPSMRHDRLTRSAPFEKMLRMRALVGRVKLMQAEKLEDGNWHFLCLSCRDSIAPLTDGVTGRTYTLSELLSLSLAHHMVKHGIEYEENYGESYA